MTLSVISVLKYKDGSEYLTYKTNLIADLAPFVYLDSLLVWHQEVRVFVAQFHDLMTSSVAWRMAVVVLDNLQGFRVCICSFLYCSSRQNLLCENEIASKYLFLDQRWLYVCMYGFVYLSQSCVWEASVVCMVGGRHWSLLCLIRAEHPETVSNDKGIWIKSDKYLDSNWVGKKMTASWATWRSSLLELK